MRDRHKWHLLQSRGNLLSLLLGYVAVLYPRVGTALGRLLYRWNRVEAAVLVLRFIDDRRLLQVQLGCGVVPLA